MPAVRNNNGGAIASARERRREAPRERYEMKKVLTARSDNFSGTVRDFARSVMGCPPGCSSVQSIREGCW